MARLLPELDEPGVVRHPAVTLVPACMRPQYAGPHPEVPREIRGLDHLIHPLKVWPTADKKKGREKYLLAMSNL
jgi:hypothetical protein